jgi:hypothetical protein
MGEGHGDRRLGLVAVVNGVEYPEYTPGGWLKACPLSKLRVHGPEAQALFAAYTDGRADGVELRLWLIRLFLDEEMCWLIPERSCALAIAKTPLRRLDRAGAERVVDAIIAVGEAERTGVDYARLRGLFLGELLRPESVEWFANSSADGVRPGSLSAVVGLDRELLAVFWLG